MCAFCIPAQPGPARPAVLLNSLDATLPVCLLFYNQKSSITLLKSTLPSPPISVADKGLITSLDATLTRNSPRNSFRSNTYKKWGEGAIPVWTFRPSDVQTFGRSDVQTVPDLMLDETQFVNVEHKNKFGQDYPKSSYDPKKN